MYTSHGSIAAAVMALQPPSNRPMDRSVDGACSVPITVVRPNALRVSRTVPLTRKKRPSAGASSSKTISPLWNARRLALNSPPPFSGGKCREEGILRQLTRVR